MITINHNTTFLVSDDLGNIPEGKEFGLYYQDTRFLCRYELTLDGQHPVLLAARATDSYRADYFLTNPVLASVPRGQLSIHRHRSVDRGMQEELHITNHGNRGAELALELQFDADFAHIFEVKNNVEVHEPLDPHGDTLTRSIRRGGEHVCFGCEREEHRCQVAIELSQRPTSVDRGIRFNLSLAPQEHWQLGIQAAAETDPRRPQRVRQWRSRKQQRERYAEAVRQMPILKTESETLARAYEQSVRDFVALQLHGEDIAKGETAIAAGVPWYVALFGRDSLIAAYQALAFRPDAAKGVLRTLARLQGTRVDPDRAEEPGKILHEHRFGVTAASQNPATNNHRYPYYGTIDATPLFLMLLAAVYGATRDLGFVRSLRANVIEALHWLDRYGDRDGDGYVEYLRESDGGLDNQGWKDSWDAIRFGDGALARPPIALGEVQGYAYAARVGLADVFAALGESDRAVELRRSASALKQQFNRDFWLPERGYYALALDAEKRPVDAITSNPGHLLWTGIADFDKAQQVAARLLSPELFSGWGVRTMATTERAYNPISYHNGSIWPHDNSIIVAGLARYGFVDEATRLVDGLVSALGDFPDHRLPELFAGYSRTDARFPVEYPTTNRPQAWASGSVLLLLTAMAGINFNEHTTQSAPFLPSSVQQVRLDGLRIHQRRVAVEIERWHDGTVSRSFDGSSNGAMRQAANLNGTYGSTDGTIRRAPHLNGNYGGALAT